MRYTTRTVGLIVPFVLLSMAACFSLGRDSPPLEQYVLGRVPVPEAAGTSPDATGFTIGMRRLQLAPYLASPAIVVRRGTHQIVTSDFHRWGEDPAESINRAVARYLAASRRVRAVDVAPWPGQARYDYLMQLHVAHFEGVAPEAASALAGEVHILASWEIVRQRDGAVLARGTTDYRQRGWSVGDYARLVMMLDEGLSALARDMVSCLGILVAAAPPEDGDTEPIPPRGPALECAP